MHKRTVSLLGPDTPLDRLRGTATTCPAGSMRYSVHKPSPRLSGLVSYLWCLSDAPRHERERIVPSGTSELVINLQEDEFRIYGSAPTGKACRRFRGAIVSGLLQLALRDRHPRACFCRRCSLQARGCLLDPRRSTWRDHGCTRWPRGPLGAPSYRTSRAAMRRSRSVPAFPDPRAGS